VESAIEQGLIFALLALGVFLTYRILDLPDLTVDGSFTTGGGTAAILLVNGCNPWLATLAGFAAGALAGLITGLLHTKLHIDGLLASILTMIGLYSINLRIMQGPLVSVSLKNGVPVETLFSGFRAGGLLYSWQMIGILAIVAVVFKFIIDWFLATNFGLAVQATGDNSTMALADGISITVTKNVTLMVSNGLVGLSGALYAQFNGSADSQMGIGMILVGLASVIVGNAIFGTRFMFLATLGVVVGSVLYRLVIFWAIDWHLAESGDMKFISATMVVIALVLSKSERLRHFFSFLSPWRVKSLPSDLPIPISEVVSASEGKAGG
jgi:putative ABC transport system permease protein